MISKIISQKNIVTFLALIMFTFFSNLKAQNSSVEIKPNFKIDSTYINFTVLYSEKKNKSKKYINSGNFSLDNKKIDSLIVSIGANGITSYWIRLNLEKNKIQPNFLIVTDYKAYDGRSYYEIPIQHYNLLINKVNLRTGDDLYFRISGETNNFYGDKVIFEAEVYHIVGKKMKNNKVIR